MYSSLKLMDVARERLRTSPKPTHSHRPSMLNYFHWGPLLTLTYKKNFLITALIIGSFSFFLSGAISIISLNIFLLSCLTRLARHFIINGDSSNLFSFKN